VAASLDPTRSAVVAFAMTRRAAGPPSTGSAVRSRRRRGAPIATVRPSDSGRTRRQVAQELVVDLEQIEPGAPAHRL
jgi:hypothetical protein